MITLKGQPLSVWKDWITNELTPPVVCSEQTAYVLKAFLELINKYEKADSSVQ